MGSGPETRLQNSIRKEIKASHPGAVVWKIHGGPMQAAGIPDLVGCIDGHFIALEVKLPSGGYDATRLQESTMASVRRAGGLSTVVTSVEDALDVISKHLNRD